MTKKSLWSSVDQSQIAIPSMISPDPELHIQDFEAAS